MYNVLTTGPMGLELLDWCVCVMRLNIIKKKKRMYIFFLRKGTLSANSGKFLLTMAMYEVQASSLLSLPRSFQADLLPKKKSVFNSRDDDK